jgi:RHS repeat-associated protein
MNYKYGDFVQMSNAAREDGSHPTILAQELSFLPSHELLSQQVVAEEVGYFYIYLSNESQTGSEAFFDDFSIQVSESFIVQQIDYYPYGMVAKNWTRVGDKATKDLFQGKTYEDLTKWYDFHARQYDASLGRWFGTDPKAGVMPYNSPYSAMMNNPVMFTDPDGELPILAIIAIGAAVFGSANVAVQATNGHIKNFWDGAKAFGAGAAVGGLITAGVVTGLGVPVLGSIIKGAGIAYGGSLAIGTMSGLGHGVFGGDWSVLGNTWKQFGGNFYLDENRNFFGQTWQGISRFSWELPQSTIGNGYSQIRNAFGGVDKVRYLGGATFSVGTNRDARMGVSIGNHINISLRDDNIDILKDPLFMHEYGHTFQSQIWGPLYLPALGLPSIISAGTSRPIGGGLTSHSVRWYEMQANRFAARYFGRNYGVDWTNFEPPLNRYPRRKS